MTGAGGPGAKGEGATESGGAVAARTDSSYAGGPGSTVASILWWADSAGGRDKLVESFRRSLP